MINENRSILNLDLDLLRTFVAVADLNTFAAAAVAVRRTQSAVSQQMQRLEQRGRENAVDIAQRLDRAARYKPDDCLTLNNDGSLRQSVDEFFRLLRSHAVREADPLV